MIILHLHHQNKTNRLNIMEDENVNTTSDK